MQTAIQEITKQFSEINYSVVQLPDGHSLNDMLVNYGADGILKLLSEKQPLFKDKMQEKEKSAIFSEIRTGEPLSSAVEPVTAKAELIHYNNQKIGFQGKTGFYYLLGGLSPDMASLKVVLKFEEKETRRSDVKKLDLFESHEIQNCCIELSEKFSLNGNEMETDLLNLRDLLLEYREKQTEAIHSEVSPYRINQALSPSKEQEAIKFLSEDNLLKRIDKLIEKSGVIGEEKNRTLLFVSASTFSTRPLHVLVQGSSGSGKSHLINAIKNCIPSESVTDLTRITSKSLYNYQGNELVNKLIVVQDFDGLDDEAQLAFREAQSAGYLNSSTVIKDKLGNQQSVVRKVKAHFSSMVATTKAEVYYDNMSRSIVIGVDESEEQTRRIISTQNKTFTGATDMDEQEDARMFLQNCLRVLKPFKVVNPFAERIFLPVEAKMLRRLNEQFQCFVLQIAFLNQYQRIRDDKDRIIATTQDLKIATELFFEAIYLKVDELDSGMRQFFERLKEYLKKQPNGTKSSFMQRDVRLALRESKSQCYRYFEVLQKLEYIAVSEGSANKGFLYKIVHWDDMEKIKKKIKDELINQIDQLVQ